MPEQSSDLKVALLALFYAAGRASDLAPTLIPRRWISLCRYVGPARMRDCRQLMMPDPACLIAL